MKYTKKDFLTASEPSIKVDAQLDDLPETLFAGTPVVRVPECDVTGTLHFDGKSRVISSLQIQGVMTVPDSITGEDVDVDFDTESETEYSFEPLQPNSGSRSAHAGRSNDDEEDFSEEEVVVVKMNTIDLMDEIIQAIVYEAPMSITRLERDEFPQGSGWTLTSDQDAAPAEPQEDPRWAKLKEFDLEDDE